MVRQFLSDDGTPATWAPRSPGYQERGVDNGVHFRVPEEKTTMPKADKTGVYTLNGHRFRIKAGDVLPEGAVMDEERAEKAAPQNRAEKAAPQNRSAKADKKAD